MLVQPRIWGRPFGGGACPAAVCWLQPIAVAKRTSFDPDQIRVVLRQRKQLRTAGVTKLTGHGLSRVGFDRKTGQMSLAIDVQILGGQAKHGGKAATSHFLAVYAITVHTGDGRGLEAVGDRLAKTAAGLAARARIVVGFSGRWGICHRLA